MRDVRRPTQTWRQLSQALGTLGQNLETVPVGAAHDRKHLFEEVHRHILMKQVAHRIDEDRSAAGPAQGALEHVGVGGHLKARGVVRLPHGLEPQ